jgi:hypothetical protein
VLAPPAEVPTPEPEDLELAAAIAEFQAARTEWLETTPGEPPPA